MSREITSLKRLSICPCGFGLLDERIHIGTEYLIDRMVSRRALMLCGGCGNKQKVVCVAASSALNPDAPLMFLPVEIFLEAQ